MTTPAQERLSKLFAKTPLPPKPDLPVLIQEQVEPETGVVVQAMEETFKSSAQYPEKLDKQPQQPRASREIINSSDDDDEYAALFRKPKAKAKEPRRRYKTEPGALGYTKTDSVQSQNPIKSLPQGKLSAHAKSHSTDPSWKDEFDHDDMGYEIVSQFCPFSLVTKFPYKYMEDGNDQVSRHFFAGGKIYLRAWDIYYLHMPASFGVGPITLVPVEQVKQLLNEISDAFRIEVSVPQFPFVLPFYDDKTPHPVLLGTSHSRQEINDMQNAIPEPVPNHGEYTGNDSPSVRLSFQKWHEKCTKAQQANKKTKSNSKKKTGRAQASFPERCDQLKRAQRYFGLRPRMKSIDDMQALTWDQREDLIQAQYNHRLSIKFLNLEEIAPYEFDGQPVIISIDVESYERNHSLITEIGVSTLDTLDLVNVIPGQGGEEWTKLIRSRHFLINGRENLVNRDFVNGCPESFHFGGSERVDLDRIADVVDSCFEWPFSAQHKHDGKFGPEVSHADIQSSTGVSVHKELLSLQKGSKERNIILLGHDIDGDITYLSKLGSGIFGKSEVTSNGSPQTNRHRILASVLEALDTAVLFQAMTSEIQPQSLGFLCNYLDIDSWHLHNAGNDARYTLESLVKIAIKSRQIQDDAVKKMDPNSTAYIEEQWESERTRLTDERMTQSQRNLREEIEILEEARARGVASPMLISSAFQGSLPILIKKSTQPAQTPSDREEAIRLWTAAQDQGDNSTWG